MIRRHSSPRKKRHRRVRAKIKGTRERPRVSVFRSNRFIYAQLIDDQQGETLAAAADFNFRLDKNLASLTKVGKAGEVGRRLAGQAKKLGIGKVVFDRGGYKYHGRVKALAEALRKEGLKL